MPNKPKGIILILIGGGLLFLFSSRFIMSCGIILAAVTGRLAKYSGFEIGRGVGYSLANIVLYGLFIFAIFLGIKLLKKPTT